MLFFLRDYKALTMTSGRTAVPANNRIIFKGLFYWSLKDCFIPWSTAGDSSVSVLRPHDMQETWMGPHNTWETPRDFPAQLVTVYSWEWGRGVMPHLSWFPLWVQGKVPG